MEGKFVLKNAKAKHIERYSKKIEIRWRERHWK